MKKTAIVAAAAMLLSVAAASQDGQDTFRTRYGRQVRMVGAAGVGVESILDSWEEAFPDDPALHEGRYKYWMAKAVTTEVIPRKERRYLGSEPVLSLKDSTGADVYYFEDNVFTDSLFTKAMLAIDRAVALAPEELAYRVDRITSFMLYEKESPELTTREILNLAEYDRRVSPQWTYYGQPVDREAFYATLQEYCWNLFKTGTPDSYEAFRTVSEAMLKLNPKDASSLNNMGSYWFVYRKNARQALKWYNKVFKVSPDDYNAAKNCVLLARREKNEKLEMKYLPMLIRATDSEQEKAACQSRLEMLEKKKR